MRIYRKLHLKKYRNLIDIMPKLNQIQTYIKTRRKAVGNNNDIDELKKYLKSIRYNPNTTGDKLFPY